MLGKGLVREVLRGFPFLKGLWQTGVGQGEGLCRFSWVQTAGTSREAVAAHGGTAQPPEDTGQRCGGQPRARSDAPWRRCGSWDSESPEDRGRFRKGFPARGEGAVNAARAERGRGFVASPGVSPRCRAVAPRGGDGVCVCV